MGLCEKEAAHEGASLVEVDIGGPVPVVEPADRVELLTLVPGAIDVAEAEVAEGGGTAAAQGQAVVADPGGIAVVGMGRRA